MAEQCRQVAREVHCPLGVILQRLICRLPGKFQLLCQASDVLGLFRFPNKRVFHFLQRFQHQLAVRVQFFGKRRACPFHFRPPLPAIDQGGDHIRRKACQPVIEEVPNLLGRGFRSGGKPQLGKPVGDGGRHTPIRRLYAQLGGSYVRTAA